MTGYAVSCVVDPDRVVHHVCFALAKWKILEGHVTDARAHARSKVSVRNASPVFMTMGAAVKLMHYHLSDAYSSSGPEKSEAFRLPLAKKMSTQSITLPCQIDGAWPSLS